MSVIFNAVDKENVAGPWKLSYGASQGRHTHCEAAASSLANHRTRERRDDLKKILLDYRRTSVFAKQTRALAIQQFTNDLDKQSAISILRDIYNEWAKIRSMDLESNTQTEALLRLL